jgi:chorismate dehydratase
MPTTDHAAATAAPPPMRTKAARLGAVSFLNTLPLIDGLANLRDVEVRYSVPSLLSEMLRTGEVDLALCSSIDFQRGANELAIVPCGLLGCEGPTLTVRLYSHVPIEAIHKVYCDTDSHTSVVLMQIVLRDVYNIEPELVEFDAREHVAENRAIDWPETMLLIGDKVVTDSPPAVRYPHQLDLGKAWWDCTGLPFVFAIWMARKGIDPGIARFASMVLDRQRRHNIERLERIAHRAAAKTKWPVDLARTYLRDHLVYEVTPKRLEGLELFYRKAHEHDLIPSRRELHLLDVS